MQNQDPNPKAETKTVPEGHFGWNLAFIFSDKGNSFNGGGGHLPTLQSGVE